ncbi:hypothetical protein KUCAC02_009715, partial [Chaenocephalus aceratus]
HWIYCKGKTCYYETLLPTLETLMSRTLALQNGLSRMTANLPVCNCTGYQDAIRTGVGEHEALLAALTLPKFKVRWIVGAERREAARALLIAECRTLPRDEEPANNKNREAAAHSSANENDFFSLMRKRKTQCPLAQTRSAPVERLFSLGGIVLSPRRNRLSDKRFERLLLMRYNRTFCTDVE